MQGERGLVMKILIACQECSDPANYYTFFVKLFMTCALHNVISIYDSPSAHNSIKTRADGGRE